MEVLTPNVTIFGNKAFLGMTEVIRVSPLSNMTGVLILKEKVTRITPTQRKFGHRPERRLCEDKEKRWSPWLA